MKVGFNLDKRVGAEDGRTNRYNLLFDWFHGQRECHNCRNKYPVFSRHYFTYRSEQRDCRDKI